MKALVDADSLLYRAVAGIQENVQWEDGSWSYFSNPTKTKELFDSFVEDILENTGCEEYLLVFTGEYNFRYDVLESYKHNRASIKHPLLLLKTLKEYVQTKYNSYLAEGVEADDYCTWLMYKQPTKWILCHIDKDLNQAVGYHYNYNKKTFYNVSLEEADYFFYYQTLAGDVTDGYKGCPGIGPKKADKVIQAVREEKGVDVTEADYWAAIVATYESKTLTEEDALQQARMARMLRPSEFNGTEITQLWKPKGEKDGEAS